MKEANVLEVEFGMEDFLDEDGIARFPTESPDDDIVNSNANDVIADEYDELILDLSEQNDDVEREHDLEDNAKDEDQFDLDGQVERSVNDFLSISEESEATLHHEINELEINLSESAVKEEEEEEENVALDIVVDDGNLKNELKYAQTSEGRIWSSTYKKKEDEERVITVESSHDNTGKDEDYSTRGDSDTAGRSFSHVSYHFV